MKLTAVSEKPQKKVSVILALASDLLKALLASTDE
jgi:hypothetical protein